MHGPAEKKSEASSKTDSLGYVDAAHIRQLCGFIKNERIKYSCAIGKINKKRKNQTRHLVITNEAVYNISPKSMLGQERLKLRRRIPLLSIGKIFISYTTSEFQIHVSGEYDYRFKHKDYGDIVKVIQQQYEDLAKKWAVESRPTIVIVDLEAQQLDEFMIRKGYGIDERRAVEARIHLHMERPRSKMIRLPLNLYTGMKVDGVRIRSVDEESISEKAGLKAGMILQEIEDSPVSLNSSGERIQQILEGARELALQKDTELLRIKVYDTEWNGIERTQTFTMERTQTFTTASTPSIAYSVPSKDETKRSLSPGRYKSQRKTKQDNERILIESKWNGGISPQSKSEQKTGPKYQDKIWISADSDSDSGPEAELH
mmetsp:Transcript_26696/g.64676  ORF Transcript_26696/g.64676 Transcript_26696/m.64676 type:complete len:373 (+) Transcript_26696:88-1206(+)|eukprot:CAMPEP_0114491144 /NCGR_PEP_ID=MMETSP0109-20121206/2837_1 /TAXON_ID=29199 /ORGANISM="Chlorarachnion reptans, Strain CCCM449" /LENGTH=372 /DNA_ID=CAMNT_0001667845 /DNA_START=21 /DNA_END=1139 /DNA_ORIENTATION=-